MAGNIALIQRGTCTFREKVENAQAAGAAGVVIFNEGNVVPDDDRVGNLFGTLDPPQVDIPVVGTSFAVGKQLYDLLQLGRVTLRLEVDATVVTTRTENVIADTPTGRADRTVVVGAHLDSVAEGPGINDNGSGSATDLEVALQMAELGIQPRNKVRFAFWGAEEARPDRLAVLHRQSPEEGNQEHRRQPELRHGRLPELRPLRLRRRRLRH